jgi:hypothetical protein
MPRYRLTERTLIGNDLVEPGEVEFDGLPTRIFVPLDEEGEAKRAEYEAVEAKRQADNLVISGREAMAQIDPTLAAAVRQIVIDTMAEINKPKTAAKAKAADLA